MTSTEIMNIRKYSDRHKQDFERIRYYDTSDNRKIKLVISWTTKMIGGKFSVFSR